MINLKSTIKNENFKKNMIWNLIGASTNALTSLFFLIIVTRINGIEDSGIFTLAFSLACLFCIFGGYQGRIFQVTDVNKEFNDKEYILHRYITFSIMLALVVCYTVLKGYSSYKITITLLLCLLKGLEVLADVYYGVMQKNNVLYKSGFSLALKSIISTLVFFIIDFISGDLILSCVLLCFVWLAILIFYDIPQTKNYLDHSERVNLGNTFKIFKVGFFAFAVLFLSVYLVNAPKYALDGVVAPEQIAVFGIILMPATVLSLCAQYILQPFLPKLSIYYAEGRLRDFHSLVKMLLFMIIVIGVLAVVVGCTIGLPVLQYIYNVQLDKYFFPFLVIIVGAIFYALSILLSAVLTTIRRTYQQFLMYIIISLIALISSYLLIQNYMINGAAISYFLIMCAQFVMYFIYYLTCLNGLKKERMI